jgi:hypothetical protein
MQTKRSYQNVKFSSVQECFEYIPEDERKIALILRGLVFDCIPNIQEKLSFNVPFYKLNKGICFIWPASITWGKKESHKGVRFGFQHGNLLEDSNEYLAKEHRKQVYWRDFQRITEEDIENLKDLLFQAVIIDGEKRKATS